MLSTRVLLFHIYISSKIRIYINIGNVQILKVFQSSYSNFHFSVRCQEPHSQLSSFSFFNIQIVVAACRNRQAGRSRGHATWKFWRLSISFILRFRSVTARLKKTRPTWNVVERAIQIEVAVFSTHIPLKQKLQCRMMELCGRKVQIADGTKKKYIYIYIYVRMYNMYICIFA